MVHAWICIEADVWIPLYLFVDYCSGLTLDIASIIRSASMNVLYKRLLAHIARNSAKIPSKHVDAQEPYVVNEIIGFKTRLRANKAESDQLKITFNICRKATPGCPAHGFIGIDAIAEYGIVVEPRKKVTSAATTYYDIKVEPHPGRK